MPNMTLPTYLSPDLIRTHMRASLGGFYSDYPNRLLLYFVLGGIFMVEGLLALALYKGPYLLISHMDFATVYALHTALAYTGCQLAVDFLASTLLPDWAGYPRRTVGKQWMIWSTGFVLAFIVHRTVVLCLVHIYAPEVVAYYADPQRLRPNHWAVFLYTLPYWTAGVFLAVSISLRLQGRRSSNGRHIRSQGPTPRGALTVSNNGRILEIPYPDISHISVEDHYSRIHFVRDNTLHSVFIRKSLKSLRQLLPDDSFLQIHRSHLINLSHVFGLSKNRLELRMTCARDGVTLPVSRYRLSELRTRLENHPSKHGDR